MAEKSEKDNALPPRAMMPGHFWDTVLFNAYAKLKKKPACICMFMDQPVMPDREDPCACASVVTREGTLSAAYE